MTTVIVGCSKSKIDTNNPVKASQLYESAYFNKRYIVAKSIVDEVYILSAKHGIIHEDTKINTYDVSIYDLTVDETNTIIESVDTDIFDKEIIVLAGKKYTEIIKQACELDNSREFIVKKPLTGGIGEQLSQLNTMIENIDNNGE